MRLDEKIEEAWRKFREEAEQYGADNARDEEFGSYTDRDPISDTWNTKSKLVRLDDAIMALHIMAARHSFRGLASVKQRALRKISELIVGFIGKAAAGKLLGRVIGRAAIVQVASLIAQTVEDTSFQRDVESSVRVASFEVRSDLFREPMKANPRRMRKTKVVYTRHPIPRQRKANKSWHSPR
jgi:hypothetical protein